MSEFESKNPGETLKSSRERLGLSVNDVSVATKINPRILKALEEGNLEGLPPKSFTRGFIRSYAAYLKIDAKPILGAYKMDEAAVVIPAPGAHATAAIKEKKESRTTARATNTTMGDSSLTSKALMASGILVLVVLIFGIKKVVDKYAHERVVATPTASANKNPPSEAAPTAAALATDASDADEAADVTDKDPTAAATPTALTTTPPTPSTNAASTAAPAVIPPVTPVSPVAVTPSPALATPVSPTAKALAKPETKTPDTKATAKPADVKPAETKPADVKTAEVKKADTKAADAKATEVKAPKPATPQEVIIEALDSVEITIHVDNDAPKKVTLAPESVHTVKAKSSVELEVSDGGMINIIQNGHERGVPGVLGKPAKLKYP